jgi:hypothetical protein
VNEFDREYYRKQIEIALYIEALYCEMFESVIEASRVGHLSKDRVFLFKNHPEINKTADDILNRYSSKLIDKINDNTEWAWRQANRKNDAIVKMAFGKRGINAPSSLLNHNEKQFAAFQSRKVNGLTLSERVWDYNKFPNLKDDIQKLINSALSEGKSAQQLSQDVRQYLKNPEALFRRIRDRNGNLKLSSEALKYNPGRGVYRSAYKNAMRLAREEINRAYRESEWERWQQIPFVIGYRVITSNRVATVCPVCIELAGVYPKSFKFLGWHIQCLCHCEVIFCSDSEFDRTVKDKNYVPRQPDMPENFVKWAKENEDRASNL